MKSKFRKVWKNGLCLSLNNLLLCQYYKIIPQHSAQNLLKRKEPEPIGFAFLSEFLFRLFILLPRFFFGKTIKNRLTFRLTFTKSTLQRLWLPFRVSFFRCS